MEEDFENTAELLAAILCRGVSVQIKRGLMREYIVKEDIVYSMEYNNLNDKQAAAMLRTNAPLNDVYLKWNGWDTGYLEDKMREITAPLLRNDSDDSRIHLWIAGHVHRYWRAAKGTSELIARAPRKKAALKKSPVNWVSVDGPKGNSSNPNFSYLKVQVTADKITVKAVDENGKKMDEFQIDQKGQFRELYRGKELKAFPFEK